MVFKKVNTSYLRYRGPLGFQPRRGWTFYVYAIVTTLPEDSEKATVRKVLDEAVIFEGSANNLVYEDCTSYEEVRELYRGWLGNTIPEQDANYNNLVLNRLHKYENCTIFDNMKIVNGNWDIAKEIEAGTLL